MNASVVVLGDLGRSPRMQYQARALARHGAHVTLIGYAGQGLAPTVRQEPRLTVRALAPPALAAPRRLPRPVYVGYSLFKLARLCLALALALWRAPRADLVLVQSPPALPTLAVALLLARLRRSRLVVDWHNLGTPLLARTLGAGSLLASLHGRLERGLGRAADAHLCVSLALRQALASSGIEASVLRDGPAPGFAPRAEQEEDGALRAVGVWTGSEPRPLVIVSPCGWTEEDDLELLCRALATFEAEGRDAAPALVVLLTGRGPLRAAFERRLSTAPLARVRVATAWLEPADYPAVLRACDVGLSLHRSISGLDLAMKVVDLRGSGLPVLALDHGCVREQLAPGAGAWLFRDADELAAALAALVRGGRDGDPLRRLRREARAAPLRTFDDEWRDSARALLGL